MKTVVITGSTRGLGLELAKQFKARNYNLVICGTRQETLDQAYAVLQKGKGKGLVIGQTCNVASREEVEQLADTAMKEFGRIDIWINNAGINQSFKYAWEVSEAEIDGLLSVDLKGTINGSNAAMVRMIAQGYGAIYNVEGMGSNDAYQSCFAIYGTAKRAVTYFTDALAHEVTDQNLPITIGKLSPGIMLTDFLTSAEGKQNQTVLSEKTKKVYRILGDKPDVVAEYLVKEIIKGQKASGKNGKKGKNGRRISWLTGRKAAFRFLTAGMIRRNRDL